LFPTLGSTQDTAREMARGGAPEGTVVMALEMAEGRGRHGRRWLAPPGGLWITVILRPKSGVDRVQMMGLAASLAVAEAICRLTPLEASVKWPNDVVVAGKKVCGVLTEAEAIGSAVDFVLLGIGVNVNNEVPEAVKPVAASLRQLCGREIDLGVFLREVILELDKLYKLFLDLEYGRLMSRYRASLSMLNERVRVVTRDGEIEGVMLGVDDDGRLVVKAGSGVVHLADGEVVHLRGPSGNSDDVHSL